jgi:hypothetical protein
MIQADKKSASVGNINRANVCAMDINLNICDNARILGFSNAQGKL